MPSVVVLISDCNFHYSPVFCSISTLFITTILSLRFKVECVPDGINFKNKDGKTKVL